MKDLDLILIQQDIVWENATANLERLDQKLDSVDFPCDLVILPEMFNTGFTMNVQQCAEPVDGTTLSWMRMKAERMGCVFAGSILIKDNEKFFNRFYWVRPDGTCQFYNKRHLFTMAGEHLIMTPGKKPVISELEGWRFNLQVCYDLRFPVWSRNILSTQGYAYDMMIFVANWPEVRSSAYKALLPARAIENQCYVVWVNRVGKDGNGISHSGDSMVIDPKGEVLASCQPGVEQELNVKLSFQSLIDVRRRFPFAHDWDRFSIES